MKRDSHLKIEPFGAEYSGVRLHGQTIGPETAQFGIKFPGGEIYVVRTSDGAYWAHILTEYDEQLCQFTGEIVDSREDVLEHPYQPDRTYHVARKIKKSTAGRKKDLDL